MMVDPLLYHTDCVYDVERKVQLTNTPHNKQDNTVNTRYWGRGEGGQTNKYFLTKN